MNDQSLSKVLRILRQVLALDPGAPDLLESTRLIGNIPELDSIAIVNIILAVEEEFEFDVDDDDISAADFESVETLNHYIKRNIGE